MVRNILRFEGLIVCLAAIYFYYLFSSSWLVFSVLLFAPDISMVGYLKDKRLGAIIYNLGHNYVSAIIPILTGTALHNPFILSLGLILASHIGLDRFLGYGLKYPSGFKDTHIQKL